MALRVYIAMYLFRSQPSFFPSKSWRGPKCEWKYLLAFRKLVKSMISLLFVMSSAPWLLYVDLCAHHITTILKAKLAKFWLFEHFATVSPVNFLSKAGKLHSSEYFSVGMVSTYCCSPFSLCFLTELQAQFSEAEDWNSQSDLSVCSFRFFSFGLSLPVSKEQQPSTRNVCMAHSCNPKKVSRRQVMT